MIQFDKDWLAFMRDLFPKGTQIRCSNTKGGVPALSGEMGTVEYIGDSGIFHCTLEDGRTLVAAIDEDCFRVDLQEQAEPSGKELHQALKDRNQNLPECSESHCLQRIAILGVVDSERLPEWAADILFPPLRSILVLPGEAVRAIEVSSLRRSICRQLDAKRLDCAGSCSERESINLYFDSDAQKKGLPFNRCLDGQNYYGPVLINGMHEEARSLTDLEMIGLLQRLNAPEAMREAHKWDTSDRKRDGEATMSGIVELKLYSPLQVDIIDRDRSGPPIPLQAVNREQGGEYLGKIMNVTQYEDDFIQRAAERSLRERDKALAQKKAVLAQSEKRIAELDVIFKRIYEDNISGKLSDERFIKLSRDYEQEQAQLKAVVETLGREVKQQEQKKTNVRKFISVVKKYTDMTQLDATILREFVEQIRVSDTYTTDEQQKRVKIREIEIVYNFIGAFDFEGAREQSQTAQEQNNAKVGAA